MKKILLCGLLLGLTGSIPALAEEAKEYDGIGEMAVGARFTPYSPLQRSADFLYRPKFGVGGIAVGNSEFSEDFQGKPLTIKTTDLMAVIGFWSNQEKEDLLGWHIYLGLGVSFADVASQKYASAGSYTSVNLAGWGLDVYLTRLSALTLDASVASRRIPIGQRTVDADSNGATSSLKSGNALFQVGYRVWF